MNANARGLMGFDSSGDAREREAPTATIVPQRIAMSIMENDNQFQAVAAGPYRHRRNWARTTRTRATGFMAAKTR